MFLLVPKSGDSLKEQTEKTDKINSFFYKKEKSIVDTLEFKAKYIKRRKKPRCNLIKKEEYKYILGKSMSHYTNLSLFLIISSTNYISHPKKLINEKCSNHGVWQESVPRLDSTQTFLLSYDAVVVPLRKLFSLIR